MKTAVDEPNVLPATDELQRLASPSDAAYAGEGIAAPAIPIITSVATLLTGHVLRDGECILLALKPSRWYVVLSSVRFVAVILFGLCLLQLNHVARMRYHVDAALFVISCRLMWAMLNWMGRLYVLTDQRILRLGGVFTIEIVDCLLRKTASTALVRSNSDRLFRIGSIEVYPQDETRPCVVWHSIRQPRVVRQRIDAAIRRAKQNGVGSLMD